MATIDEFIRARLDEAERKARAVAPLGRVLVMGVAPLDEKFVIYRSVPASEDGMPRSQNDPAAVAHFTLHDPKSVLADIAAKQAILDAIPTWKDNMIMADYFGSQFDELRALMALPFAGHPDYDESWRPR